MMRLVYTNASPYARKARITALECGQELELIFDHPTAEGTRVPESNPLGKVPALILESGEVIIDSPVICEFLDQHGRNPTLLPPMGPERIRVLTIQALADGIMDATVSSVLETRRDESVRSPYWLDRWDQAIRRALPLLEKKVTGDDGFHLGTIASISALHYLDFRFPERKCLEEVPALAAWAEAMATRDSIAQTMPYDGP